jgi:hypothetical protein
MCVIANDGHLYIIVGHHGKMDKRLNNLRISLTAIRIGNAAGSDGPWSLYKGRTHKNNSLLTRILLKIRPPGWVNLSPITKCILEGSGKVGTRYHHCERNQGDARHPQIP